MVQGQQQDEGYQRHNQGAQAFGNQRPHAQRLLAARSAAGLRDEGPALPRRDSTRKHRNSPLDGGGHFAHGDLPSRGIRTVVPARRRAQRRGSAKMRPRAPELRPRRSAKSGSSNGRSQLWSDICNSAGWRSTAQTIPAGAGPGTPGTTTRPQRGTGSNTRSPRSTSKRRSNAGPSGESSPRRTRARCRRCAPSTRHASGSGCWGRRTKICCTKVRTR
mmetsp:Transcript_44648/g.142374  ORF Transcript_44648/g.142374 Transcript_44648/m.142374 type:complete len:218 (+) Transcript_44648:372-1025(+)